jgi:hypothetical protein
VDAVYAKIKRQRLEPLRKVVSNDRLFRSVDVEFDSCIEYSPSTLLAEDEWYKVSDFNSRDFFPEFIGDELISTEIADLRKEEFEKIAVLLSFQGGDYYLQKVRPSSIVKKKAVAFGDVAVVESDANRIFVNDQPDAIYLPSKDGLIFKDLARISSLFPGIDLLYREATDDQVTDFLALDFVTADNFQVGDVSKPNRRRIALALATLDRLTKEERAQILTYTQSYMKDKLAFNDEGTSVLVSTDEDLKYLMYGIEQRFYTTEIGLEKRIANSVVTI